MATKQFPLISVIVPAHNEEKLIGKSLKSIRKTNYPNYELIVICDSCSDSTPKIAKKYSKKVFKVGFKNVSEVRNYGANKANGEIIVFFDADTLVGKPVIGIPMHAEQQWNLDNLMRHGVGIMLSKKYFTERKLFTTINRIFTNYETYLNNASLLKNKLPKPKGAEIAAKQILEIAWK